MKITIAGDTCKDHYIFTYSSRDPRDKKSFIKNWKHDNNTLITSLPGGVDLIKFFLGKLDENIDLVSPATTPESKLESYATLRKFDNIYRVSDFYGFSGSDKNIYHWEDCEPKGSEIFVIDDAGNDFRLKRSNWSPLVKSIKKSNIVYYKLSWPVFSEKNGLLKAILRKKLDNLIIQITANGLREDGIHISQSLSWEKTLIDVITKFNTVVRANNPEFKPGHLLIRIGDEATAYLKYDAKGDKFEIEKFFYFPEKHEGQIDDKIQGAIQGNNALFAASIVNGLNSYNTLGESIEKVIPKAMARCIEFLERGYEYSENKIALPDIKKFPLKYVDRIKQIDLPDAAYLEQNQKTWTILEEETAFETSYSIAESYVLEGKTESMENVPIVEFGKLRLIDRDEIEKFRSIEKLIKSYFNKQDVSRPLNIAVFGPPGSGKSFGVKQITKTILGKNTPIYEFNLSQFESNTELIRALHKVRDDSLRNKCPLVFFDEFDSDFKGQELGWLKYFLAPMQDGEFRDGELVHPIGKAIFIFAGGTSFSFSDFSLEGIDDEKDDYKQFKNAKGPDFISRLKGFVDIVGVNKINESDSLYMIRRAIILRENLKKFINLKNKKNELNIHEDIIKALLFIPSFKHNSRSLSAILDMCTLEEKRFFDKSAFPSDIQLKLHVNTEVFNYILDMDEKFYSNYDAIGKDIHEEYNKSLKKKKSNKTIKEWGDLDENIKKSNILQARDNFLKLIGINCMVEKNSVKNEDIKLSKTELEFLAEWEHKRWNKEKKDAGWKYGERDEDNKIHECLLPWRMLNEDTKEYDRNAVREISNILKKYDLIVRRLD